MEIEPSLLPYNVYWDFGDGSQSTIFSVPSGTQKTEKLEINHSFSRGKTYDIILRSGPDFIGDTDEIHTFTVKMNEGPGGYVQLFTEFRLTDIQMTIIAGLLAVSLGFLTLYFPKPSWGAPADYLNAILWGSVMSEGLKYVGNLVNREWKGPQ